MCVPTPVHSVAKGYSDSPCTGVKRPTSVPCCTAENAIVLDSHTSYPVEHCLRGVESVEFSVTVTHTQWAD